jgi:hypothetical protein
MGLTKAKAYLVDTPPTLTQCGKICQGIAHPVWCVDRRAPRLASPRLDRFESKWKWKYRDSR